MHFRGVVTAAAAFALLAGCVRESEVNARPHPGTATASAVDGVQQVTVLTGTDLRFNPSTIVVHPGTVRIVLVNTAKPGAGAPHDITFTGLPRADVPTTYAGRQSAVTFTAPARGRYTFRCSIHAAQGQTGTLIVR